MKYSLVFLISFILINCQTSINKDFKISIITDDKIISYGDDIKINIESKSNIIIDSVKYFLNDVRVKNEFTISNVKLGTNSARAEVFSGGKKIELTKEFDIFSDTKPNILNYEIINDIIKILTALKVKGETTDEITGAVMAIREKMVHIEAPENTIDIVGTGGDGLNTLNISTASALVVASNSIKVAKHGNRSVSSLSGSSDILTELGVNIDIKPDSCVECINETNICFLFAPNQHPKLKNVANVRKELGVRTIFNILGPLVNPAKPQFQLLGTSDSSININMANALLNNGIQRGIVATSSSGIDEIVIHEPTSITEIRNNEILEWQFNPKDYGFVDCSLSDIQVQSLEEAYLFGVEVLNGKRGPGLDMVALNAGFCLYLLGLCDDLIECFEIAKKQLISGKVLLNLNVYAKATQE